MSTIIIMLIIITFSIMSRTPNTVYCSFQDFIVSILKFFFSFTSGLYSDFSTMEVRTLQVKEEFLLLAPFSFSGLGRVLLL